MLETTIDESIPTSHQDYVDLEEGDLKMGLIFETEDIAMKSIQLWSEKTFCPLSKVGC